MEGELRFAARGFDELGCPVEPFCPFCFFKPKSRKKGTLLIKGLLGNLVRVLSYLQTFYLGPLVLEPPFMEEQDPATTHPEGGS